MSNFEINFAATDLTKTEKVKAVKTKKERGESKLDKCMELFVQHCLKEDNSFNTNNGNIAPINMTPKQLKIMMMEECNMNTMEHASTYYYKCKSHFEGMVKAAQAEQAEAV